MTTEKTRRIAVFDTTLRDGEQAPGFHMTPAEKKRIAGELAALRVDVIEAGFPASSPDDFSAVEAIAGTVGRAPDAPGICALARCVETDIDAAIRAVSPALRGRVHVFIATSDLHAIHKLRMNRTEILDRIRRSVTQAAASGREVQFSAEDATRTDPGYLREAVKVALAAGARIINIPDTVGFALPDEFGERVRAVAGVVSATRGAVVSVHCHDDLGMAVANALSGLRAGAGQVEVTVNGIGERAGNAALEEVITAMKVRQALIGLETGVEMRRLAPLSRLVSGITGHPVAANKSVVGENAFAHGSGIHQDGMLKNPATYEIIAPEEVGAERTRLVMTARSGRRALAARLGELGVTVAGERLEGIYRRFKEAADRLKTVDDATLRTLASEPG